MPTLTRIFALLLVLAIPATTASLRSGSQTCPTSGAKQLSTTYTPAIWISIQAPSDNTGVIAFGGSTVTVAASCAAAIGNCMSASGSGFIPAISNTAANNLTGVWFACTVAADKLMYNYVQ